MADDVVEISAARLKLIERDANLAAALWNDPVHGMKVKEIAKEKWPDSNIPELDAIKSVRKSESDILARVDAKEKAVEDRIAAFEKARDDEKRADKEAKEASRFESEVESTKKKYALSAEGMEKVFQRMKDKNNPDVEAAAAWVTDHMQAAVPTGQSGYSNDMFNPFGSKSEDADWALLNKNPWDGRFAEQEIGKIQRDFANGRGSLYGANGMGGEL